MTIREIVISAGYVVDSKSAQNVEKSITGLKNFATKALSAIGIGFSLVKFNALIEEFALIKRKIESSTEGLKDQQTATEDIKKAADECRASYSDMATTVTGLLNSHNRLFSSVKQTAEFAGLMQKSFRAAGLSSADAASLSSSLTSAFSTGKVTAGQFQSIMQKAPQTILYLSKTLGISEQQIKALGMAGKLTSTQLYQAFTQNSDEINKSFGKVRLTVTDALTSIKSQFSAWLYQLDKTYHITDKVARLMLNVFTRVKTYVENTIRNMQKLSEQLGGIENLIKLIVIGVGSIAAGLKSFGLISKVAQGTTSIQQLGSVLMGAGSAASGAAAGFGGLFQSILHIGSAVAKASPWILLIIAAIMATLIAVEDLVNFLNGNDSIVGKLFEKMGVSAESLKKMIGNIVATIKNLLGSVLKIVVQVLGLAAQIIGGLLAAKITTIVKILNVLMPLLQKLIDKIMPIIQKLIEALSKIIQKVLEKVMTVLGVLLDMVVSVLDSVIKAVTPLLDLLDIVLDVLSMLLDSILELLDPILEIVDVLLGVLTDILNPVLEIISLIADAIAESLGTAIKLLMNILSPLLKIIQAILSVVAKVLSFIVRTVGSVIRTVSNLIGGLIKGPLGGIITALKNIVSFISGVFSGDWSKAWKALGNIPIAIINGIIGGFESLINFFAHAINSVTGLISGLWTWLGIPAIPKIPDVKFGRINYLAKGGYIGKDNPTPAIVGDNKNEGEIVSPISMMRDTFLDALATFTNSQKNTAGAARALTQETTNRSIVQNVNIRNDFQCGTMDVARTAKNAMSQSTEDTTAELAHALAYAR